MSKADDSEQRHPVELLAEEFSNRLRSGEHPTIEEYARKHPDHADLIRSVFPSIAMVERVSESEEKKRSSSAPSTESTQSKTTRIPESLGDFQIVREIGRGGMGIVYEAMQRSLNRRVALKVINAMVSENPQHRARFRREAESAASLHHTNIVPIYGIGENHELQYYAMQLIDGVTLHDVLDQFRQGIIPNNTQSPTKQSSSNALPTRNAPHFDTVAAAKWMLSDNSTASTPLYAPSSLSKLSPPSTPNSPWMDHTLHGDSISPTDITIVVPDMANAKHDLPDSAAQQVSQSSTPNLLSKQYYHNVANLIASVANALAFAHHQNILHRDIKPANLLLDKEGTIWITDFGLARRTDLEAATQTGEVLGTLRYMAPEQFSGHGDARVDIYSLGLTLYELLTWKPAISSPKLRLLDPERNSVISTPRAINPGIPIDLQTIVLKACAFSPEHRYQHAGEFEEDLRRFLDDRPILAKKTSMWETVHRWARRNPAIASLLSITMLLLVVIASILAIWNRQQDRSLTAIRKEFDRAERLLEEKSDALVKVQQEYSRAEANLDLSLDAFDKITSNIASRGNTLASISQLEDLESDELTNASLSQADVALLESLLNFFDRFSEMNDKDLRVESAVARHRVADIQHKIGELDKAEKTYNKALESFRNLRSQFPDRADIVLSEVTIYNELVILAAKRGQLPKTAILFQDARRSLDQSPSVAKSAEGRFALAKLLNSMGTLGAKFGRDVRIRPPGFFRPDAPTNNIMPAQKMRLQKEAEINAEALTLLKTLNEEEPSNAGYSLVLARALKDEVRIAKLTNDMSRADNTLNRSIAILESLCKSHPESTAFQYELAETLSVNVGSRPVDFERLQRSIEIANELLKEHAEVPEYRALKASILVKQSSMAYSGNRAQQNENLLQEAIAIQRDLQNRYPDVAIYAMGLVQSLTQLSEMHLAQKRPEKARLAMTEAIQVAEAFSKGNKSMTMLKANIERLRERKIMIESRISQPDKPL